MRHAAPLAASDRKLSRAAQIILGAALYAVVGLSVCTITLTAALTIWSLWQWLGVN